ncbi:MAG: TetR/AcrR family transcriptional regulator [Pseudomonadota bacterium]
MTFASNNPYHHGDLRKILINEAARLLSQNGENGLSMRKLAGEIGVSRTAPYHHFKDKHELLCAIAEEGFHRFDKIFVLDYPTISEKDLQDFARAYLSFAIDSSEYYDLMFGGKLWKSKVLTKTLKEAAYACFRQYVEQVHRWQASRPPNPNLDALRYAQVTWSALHGMSRLLIDGIYLDKAAMNPICDQAGTMFWHSLFEDPRLPRQN